MTSFVAEMEDIRVCLVCWVHFLHSYLKVAALCGGHAEKAAHGVAGLLRVGRGEGGVIAAGGQVVGGGIEGGRGGRGKVVGGWRGRDAVPITALKELRGQDVRI